MKHLRWGVTDPVSREKIKAYPASKRIFWLNPVSRRMLPLCSFYIVYFYNELFRLTVFLLRNNIPFKYVPRLIKAPLIRHTRQFLIMRWFCVLPIQTLSFKIIPRIVFYVSRLWLSESKKKPWSVLLTLNNFSELRYPRGSVIFLNDIWIMYNKVELLRFAASKLRLTTWNTKQNVYSCE